jgi:hypothetical protein
LANDYRPFVASAKEQQWGWGMPQLTDQAGWWLEGASWWPPTALAARAKVATSSRISGVLRCHSRAATPMALALPEEAGMARPTGVGRALATYEIPIEGRDEWVAAARRLA